jgi:V8-like Glu-specific endopeptidase
MRTPASIFALLLTASAAAQVAPSIEETIPVRGASGTVQNDLDRTAVLYQHVVRVDHATSMRLHFGRTKLADGVTLRLTSVFDGGRQHLTQTTLEQWRYGSAWFNGPIVVVELVAEGGTDPSHVTMESATVQQWLIAQRSICGPLDDRELHDDPRCGRLMPIGCSTWLIDDVNHGFLSAGHCADAMDIVEFNVPLSDGNGNPQHPGPEDQYAVDEESVQFDYTGLGNDWMYYGCFPNTETGLTPALAQGDFFSLAASAPPVSGQSIRITGYGTTYWPVDPTWNQVQKTHAGSYDTMQGTMIAYVVDTTGGNSGSPVLNEDTNEAIGIHTNGGCGANGGENWGTAVHNTSLQWALDNPQGVLIPNPGVLITFPGGVPSEIMPGVETPLIFLVTEGLEEPVPETVQFSLVTNNGTQELPVSTIGNDTYTVTIPVFECGDDVAFFVRAMGDEGGITYEPPTAPDDAHPLAVGTPVTTDVLSADFAIGLPFGWTISGLWHATSACAPDGSCDGNGFAYFGQDASCDYETGDTVSGNLTSPSFDIPHTAEATLTYCSSLETEQFSNYDLAAVSINNIPVDFVSESPEWEERIIDLSSFAGQTVTLRWQFDSVDSNYNDFPGWRVDGIVVSINDVDCTDPPQCAEDVDGDGVVGVNDLLTIIGLWGTSGGPADVNGDNSVDILDLLAVIAAWGSDC